jgi:hypothetical protein
LTKTPNSIVTFYLIDILVALPPPDAAKLIKTVAEIANGARQPPNFQHLLPKLIVHLASGGQGPAAFRLFDAMYSLRRRKVPDGSDEVSFPDTSNDLWHLQEGLKSILPALLAVDAKKVIHALCSKLKAVLHGERLLSPGIDHSFIIDQRIAMADANGFSSDVVYDAGTLFVRAILTAARSVIQSGSIDAEEVFGIIEGKKEIIFKCVSFSLLASIRPQAVERALAIMTKPKDYAEPVCRVAGSTTRCSPWLDQDWPGYRRSRCGLGAAAWRETDGRGVGSLQEILASQTVRLGSERFVAHR